MASHCLLRRGDPDCSASSNRSWIAPSAAIRYTIRFVRLSGSPAADGRTKTANAWPLPVSYHSSGLWRSTSVGIVNTLMTLCLRSRTWICCLVLHQNGLLLDGAWPDAQFESRRNSQRLDRLRRFEDGRYRPRGEVDQSQVVTGRHVDQSRRQVPRFESRAPTSAPNRSRAAPSSTGIVPDQLTAHGNPFGGRHGIPSESQRGR